MYLIKKPKTLKHKLHAVSPVVATLVLIVVAIVGAIAVGLIMSRVASDTSNQANVGNVKGNAQETLTIGGSTTIYPVTQAAIAAFEQQYPGITVNDAQGGSGAGMEGVTIGALDIGAASSLSAVTSAQTSDSSLNPPVQLVPTEIGGSGVVVIENGLGAGGFITDLTAPTPNVCQVISKAALALIYGTTDTTGYFTIPAGTCAAGIASTATVGVPAATPGAIQTVSRSDLPSGTEDTMSGYIGIADTNGFAGLQVVGNPGVLAQVQKVPGANNPGGSLGFVDYGFASGTAVGLTTGDADGVAIAQVYTTTAPTAPFTLAIASGTSASAVGTAILTGLKDVASNTNFYPDTAGSLVRTFYYVTNGNPTPTEQDFLNFMTNPSAESYFTSQGYYPIYSFA
jgi:phosphate transport system substrate-binding protein